MSARLGSASVTDTGRRRRHNEDAYVCEPPLFAVADGMGGAQAGELASGLAAAALRDETSELTGGEQRVDDLIQEANRRVYQRQSQDASASRDGHDDDGRARRGRPRRDRPRRRLARLPDPRTASSSS